MVNRKSLTLLLKIALSIGAFSYVLMKIDLHQLLLKLKEIDIWLFMVALIAFNISKIISSIRLNQFFKAISLNLTELEALRLYYIGMFYNLFLPGGIGGDGYKIYLLNRHRDIKTKALLGATLLDRISGLSFLLFFGAILFLFSDFLLLFPWLKFIDILGLFLLFPVTWLFYRGDFKRVFFSTLLLGALTQLFQLISAYFLALSLGIDHHIVEILTLFLISSVVAILPLSIGGVGIREFVFLYGFNLITLPTEEGVAFSMLFFIITAISSFLGIFLEHKLEK